MTSAVNRRRRASGSILGSSTSGSAIPSRSSSSSKSSGSASESGRDMSTGGLIIEIADCAAARSSRATTWNGRRWCAIHKTWRTPRTPRSSQLQRLRGPAALLPMPGGPTTPPRDPWPPIERSSIAATVATPTRGRPTSTPSDRQPRCAAIPNSRCAGTGSSTPLMRTISGSPSTAPLDQPRGGHAEHHRTGRSHRLHPLRHTDLLTDGGVPERS